MMPTARLFRSRWTALLWAGGIVWTAIDVANSAPAPTTANVAAAARDDTPADAMGEPTNAADLAEIANVIGD